MVCCTTHEKQQGMELINLEQLVPRAYAKDRPEIDSFHSSAGRDTGPSGI